MFNKSGDRPHFGLHALLTDGNEPNGTEPAVTVKEMPHITWWSAPLPFYENDMAALRAAADEALRAAGFIRNAEWSRQHPWMHMAHVTVPRSGVLQ